ncbi:hypothetical protein R9X47_28760 [Wukongibacter baidiensis]|uniref:hypothetical protein n=1 Tax=Wukongibacter baidiensis TaxID=1723361 RepID=UPI003D7FD857
MRCYIKRIILVVVFLNLFLIDGFADENEVLEVEYDDKLNSDIVAKSIEEFIPKGWAILDLAEGDLNKDGINDKAFIIEPIDKSTLQRNLLIVFGNKDGTYTLSISSKQAILLSNEGGTFGDPFLDICVDRGSVLIKFMGGSIRWHQYYRFRYQDGDWYLIGFTEGGYERIGDAMCLLQRNFNLITGDYIEDKIENGRIIASKRILPKKQLWKLKDFVANEFSAYSLMGYLSNQDIKDVSSFIPKGWNIIKKYNGEFALAEGDLNKDGINDKAFIIEPIDKPSSQGNLLIVFGNEDGTYTLSISSKNDEWGYEFEDIYIDRGSVLIKFRSGYYYDTYYQYYRFRYQDSDWYLIGFTKLEHKGIEGSIYSLKDDYNLITGDYIGKKLENGKIKTIKKNIGKKQLVKLKDFVVNEYHIQP